MISEQQVRGLFEQFSNNNIFGEHQIQKTVLEILIDLSLSELEDSQSTYTIDGEKVEINLVQKDGLHCPVYIEINRNMVDIQIGKGVEYLSNQIIKDWSDISKLRGALLDFFRDHIVEELTYCRDKLIKAVCIVNHKIENENIKVPYEMISGFCFFWISKNKKRNVYEPWV